MNRLVLLLALPLTFISSATASAQDPYLQSNHSWIHLTGTVVAAGDNSFELDYGEGIVTVEMDDWDWYREAKGLLSGDRVTVYGKVDDDFYETTSIEASSVYVENLNTYFYASPVDDEELTTPVLSTVYMDVDAELQLTGTVTNTSGREFTVDTGSQEMKVDTSQMLYNPLDDKGFQKIIEGDMVQVSGDLDNDLFEQREVLAESIITLAEDRTKNKENNQESDTNEQKT